jgi:dihydroorotate dehydrogenase (NAD+) catalytic subunit
VQVGTAIFNDPKAPVKIIEGIESFMEEEGIGSLTEIIGGMVIDGP